jgi:hypothetical protein
MSRTSRLISAILLAFFLAACGEAGSTPVGPEGPSFDSGVGSGGANREGEEEPAITTASAASDTSSVGRTGVGSGGSN